MKAKEITLTSLLIAIGIILPMFTHYIAAGPVILPMHIPVLIAGFVLKPRYAVIVGLTTPILSSIITGMPPAFPMLPIMAFELLTYALVASVLRHYTKTNIYIILILSLISGRIVAGLVAQILIIGFSAPFPSGFLFIKGAIITGIIGIVIQLVIIPPIVTGIEKVIEK